MPGLEDTYHWALMVGPKAEDKDSRGHQFHAKEKLELVGNPPVAKSVWQYEGVEAGMVPASMLLIRVVVGKVKDMSRLRAIFEGTPVRPGVEGWNCVEWLKEALLKAIEDEKALGTSAEDWKSVRDTAMWHVESKNAAGRFRAPQDEFKAPTWDMLENSELAP